MYLSIRLTGQTETACPYPRSRLAWLFSHLAAQPNVVIVKRHFPHDDNQAEGKNKETISKIK